MRKKWERRERETGPGMKQKNMERKKETFNNWLPN